MGSPDDGRNDRPGRHVVSCERLTGEAIVNAADDTLGYLAHVMIEVPSGRIAYAVLARGGVLGLGEKLHAIPWSALVLDSQRHCFVLDIGIEEIDRVPAPAAA